MLLRLRRAQTQSGRKTDAATCWRVKYITWLKNKSAIFFNSQEATHDRMETLMLKNGFLQDSTFSVRLRVCKISFFSALIMSNPNKKNLSLESNLKCIFIQKYIWSLLYSCYAGSSCEFSKLPWPRHLSATLAWLVVLSAWIHQSF